MYISVKDLSIGDLFKIRDAYIILNKFGRGDEDDLYEVNEELKSREDKIC